MSASAFCCLNAVCSQHLAPDLLTPCGVFKSRQMHIAVLLSGIHEFKILKMFSQSAFLNLKYYTRDLSQYFTEACLKPMLQMNICAIA